MLEGMRLKVSERLRWWRRWAGRNPLFWWSLLLASVSIAVPLCFKAPILEPSVRVLGAMLQLMGIVTVAIDLLGAGRLFRKRPLASTIAWLRELIVGPKTVTISASANVDLGDPPSQSTLTTRPKIDPAQSPEHRLAALEKYVRMHDDDMVVMRSQFHDGLKNTHARLDSKIEAVRSSLDASQRRLRDVAVGNYSLLLFGAAWLAIGVLVSVSPDLYRLIALALG